MMVRFQPEILLSKCDMSTTLAALTPVAGNPYPPVVHKSRDQRNSLVNVLLNQARKDYRQQKYESIAALELNRQSQQQASNSDDSSAPTS